ncbi:MAG: hypothetical protein ABH983_04750 [Candidatus Micrarchaeota archaeon]
MKYLSLFLIFILAFGCVDTVVPPVQEEEEQKENIVCRTIDQMVPAEFEECSDVAYTEQECGRRKLNYTAIEIPITHFCMLDGACGGKPLSQCSACQKAMTRCTMSIKNDDLKKTGIWAVAANFTLGTSVFSRDPVTISIAPNETAVFDFQHFYTPGVPINSAGCNLVIKEPAVVDDCYEITRTRQECVNVTRDVSIQKEVCE